MTRALRLCSILTLILILVSCSSNKVSLHTHCYSSWEILTQPTCTDSGTLERVCTCGHTEQTTVPALDHAYDDGKVISEPTCTERGLTSYTCKLCGEVKMTITDKVSHMLSNYYIIDTDYHAKECTVCFKLSGKEEHYYYDDVCIVCEKAHDSSLDVEDGTE